MKKLFLLFIVCGLGLAYSSANIANTPAESESQELPEITAKISGNAYITRNLEASVKFYTEYLNFREARRFTLKGEDGVASFGLDGDKTIQYVSMLPAEFSETKKYLVGVAFAEIVDAQESSLLQKGDRKPTDGEIYVAYSVTGLVEIEKRMRESNVPVVKPLSLSASGKSQTLTVIDPNGIRIQMYEYLKK